MKQSRGCKKTNPLKKGGNTKKPGRVRGESGATAEDELVNSG